VTSKLKSKLIAQLRIAPIHYLTIVVLVATLFIPKQVYNYEEMKALHLGYPVGFYHTVPGLPVQYLIPQLKP